MAKPGVRPLTSRPMDIVYLIWFALHLVIMFCVDLVPMYPDSFKPAPLLDLRNWYIDTYQDRQFVTPTAWFTWFMYMEAFYHVPLSGWAVFAIIKDDPLVPLHLLIWAIQTAVTTGVCIVEYNSWAGISEEVRNGLHGLYGPYFALAVLMGCDMFFRLTERLTNVDTREKVD